MPATVPKWLGAGAPPTLTYFVPPGPSVKSPNLDKPRSHTMSLARMMEMNLNSPQNNAVILHTISHFQARSASTSYLRSYVMTASPAASP
jgi:hypothetical protein